MTAPVAPVAPVAPIAPKKDDDAVDYMAEFRTLLKDVAGLKPGERDERLLHENYRIRERARTLREQVATMAKNAPPQGAVILTGDDATAYGAIQKVGVALKDIPARLTERDTLAAEKAQQQDAAIARKVAQSLELNEHAFELFVTGRGLVVSFREEKVRDEDGKLVAVQVPVVRKRGEAEDKARPLADVLEGDEFANDLPLLLAEGGALDSETERQGTTRGARRDTEQPSGIPFPSQRAGAPSGASAARKKDEAAVEKKAGSGRYRSF